MTNREKYAQEILDVACGGNSIAMVDGKITKCSETDCVECDFSGSYKCRMKIAEWANSEYDDLPVDWSKIAVDTPIWVRTTSDHLEKWQPRYFAKYENGEVYAWSAGATSWTNEGLRPTRWKYAKLAESEDTDA